jgi:hypothetical protein
MRLVRARKNDECGLWLKVTGNKLRARIPDAQIWMVRVGYRSVHRFGGRDDRRETR